MLSRPYVILLHFPHGQSNKYSLNPSPVPHLKTFKTHTHTHTHTYIYIYIYIYIYKSFKFNVLALRWIYFQNFAAFKFIEITISVSLKGYVVQKIGLITAKTLRWNFKGLRIGVSIKFSREYGFVWVLPSVDSLKYLWSIEQVVPKFFVAEGMWSQQSYALHKHKQCLSEAFLTEFSWYCTNSRRRLR